jgi:hypothetical protein
MACHHHTPRLATTEEAVIVLFCLIDDAYARLNPRTPRRYESLKSASRTPRGYYPRLGVQQLRGVERANAPSSCATPPASSPTCSPGWSASRPPRCTAASASFAVLPLEPLRRGVVAELVGEPETLIVDSTLLSVLHPPGRSSSPPRASKARRG